MVDCWCTFPSGHFGWYTGWLAGWYTGWLAGWLAGLLLAVLPISIYIYIHIHIYIYIYIINDLAASENGYRNMLTKQACLATVPRELEKLMVTI